MERIQLSLTSWKGKEKGQFVSPDQMERIQPHLHSGRGRGKVNLLVQITWKESNNTYILEEVNLSDHMRRIEHHLLAGRKRGKIKLSAQIMYMKNPTSLTIWKRSICQPRSHEKNQVSLNLLEKGQIVSPDHMERIPHHLQTGRERVNLSAQIAWEESNLTYLLEGKEERPTFQPRSHGKNPILLTIWKRSNCQPRSHRKNPTLHTTWKGKGKGQFVSPYHIERIQLSLTPWKGKGKGQIFSPDHIGRIPHHLHPGGGRGKVKLSAQITWEESNLTYILEGKGERSIC